MAYVVRRRGDRFEIRESVHTPAGPRARTLANFSRMTDQTLATAASRSQRPFDTKMVVASARKAGAPVASGTGKLESATPGPGDVRYRRFVESSRRMVTSLDRKPSPADVDPGGALIELLGFAEQVHRSQPRRHPEPPRFPPLARLVRGPHRS